MAGSTRKFFARNSCEGKNTSWTQFPEMANTRPWPVSVIRISLFSLIKLVPFSFSHPIVKFLLSVWVYDKRPANGAAFVYFGMLPVDSGSTEAKLLVNYCHKVLDALALKNGPAHVEIIMTPSGPCLVEVNCRAQGGDGNWRPLARRLAGG